MINDLIVEYLSKDISLDQALPRIYKINPGKTLLVGAPKSGKTTLAKEFALQYKKPIYISMTDTKILHENLNATLLKIYLEKKIDCLVIDDIEGIEGEYTKIQSMTLPNIDNIVLISKRAIDAFDGFAIKKIYPLTFGEYVGFESKNKTIEQILSSFLKDGNSPQMAFLPPSTKEEIIQKQLNAYFLDKVEIMPYLLMYHGLNLSVHQLYSTLKKHQIKISKDKLYPFIDTLKEQGIIHFISDKDNKQKRLYLGDFSMLGFFRLEKIFSRMLENVLLLELMKMERDGEIQGIYMHQTAGFVVVDSLGEESLYLCLAFEGKESVEQSLKRFSKVSRAVIITLNFQGSGIVYSDVAIHYRAIEFSIFALKEFENI